MLHQIKHRFSGEVIYECEADTLAECLLRAIDSGADLRGADLTGANLTGADLRGANLTRADLRGANLTDANLRGADLRGADLTGANLTGADLRGADLRGADLTGANLTGADLRGANLTRADLRGANLRGANLRDANLTGADLTPIRDDIWAVLCSSPREVFGLRSALVAGQVDGSAYRGDCACLVGTLANQRHCTETEIPGLTPNASRPAERFFLAICPGDTPANSQFAALAVEWIDQWHAALSGNPFDGQDWPVAVPA